MTEENIKKLDEAIKRYYNDYVSRPLRILEIFNNFFGEEFVDMQNLVSYESFASTIKQSTPYDLCLTSGSYDYNIPIIHQPDEDIDEIITYIRSACIQLHNPFILVHFPKVRVTNEHNRFIDITHLYAKVELSYTGQMLSGFKLNRSEYTAVQMLSDYMHSHIPYIPSSDFANFLVPCLGSGPIAGTIRSLKIEYCEDLWELFCLELSKYVTVESLTGRPYKYLESIGALNKLDDEFTPITFFRCGIPWDFIEPFVRHFIKSKKLKFSYKNGSYTIGMGYVDFMLCISNEFIHWYNTRASTIAMPTLNRLLTYNVLIECIVSDNSIYRFERCDTSRIRGYEGKYVCTFKGKDVRVHITEYENLNLTNYTLLLHRNMALFILNAIIKVLNYNYGRKTNNIAEDSEGQVDSKVRFL